MDFGLNTDDTMTIDDCDVDSFIFLTDRLDPFPLRRRVLLLYHRYGPDLPLAIFPCLCRDRRSTSRIIATVPTG